MGISAREKSIIRLAQLSATMYEAKILHDCHSLEKSIHRILFFKVFVPYSETRLVDF